MSWYNEAIFYHIYPLGLTGAPKENDYGTPVHRLNTLLPWIDHIKDHADAFFMAGFYKIGEIFIGSKTGIQFFVIGCLIAMSDTFKKRPYI